MKTNIQKKLDKIIDFVLDKAENMSEEDFRIDIVPSSMSKKSKKNVLFDKYTFEFDNPKLDKKFGYLELEADSLEKLLNMFLKNIK